MAGALKLAMTLMGLHAAMAAPAHTCGSLRNLWTANGCCDNAANDPVEMGKTVVDPTCPYNFNKPACVDAEPQAPRDLTTGAEGHMEPKAPVLTEEQAENLPLANVHFHLGAEHKSDSYNDAADSDAWDAHHGKDWTIRRLAEEGDADKPRHEASVRPGFMCSSDELSDAEKEPYNFVYCKGDVKVGSTYEVHYVHSSAGYHANELSDETDPDLLSDGLGGAANGRGLLNPMVVVQAQVFQIVNDADAPNYDDMLHGWSVVGHENSVMYSGSTTGPSHNNEVCSPYVISWHADKDCHKVSARSFDNLCKQMKEKYELEGDLAPHGSRAIVDPHWVVKSEFVFPLQ